MDLRFHASAFQGILRQITLTLGVIADVWLFSFLFNTVGRASLVAQTVKSPPTMRETWKTPWRRAWQPTPTFLRGESPWTEDPDRQRVGHNVTTKHSPAEHCGCRCSNLSLPANQESMIHVYFLPLTLWRFKSIICIGCGINWFPIITKQA